jgi:hypothetical protein
MEIKDPVHGTIEVSRSEVSVLDSPAFQRLRLIKQLGFSEFSFPADARGAYRLFQSLGFSPLLLFVQSYCNLCFYRGMRIIFKEPKVIISEVKNRFYVRINFHTRCRPRLARQLKFCLFKVI